MTTSNIRWEPAPAGLKPAEGSVHVFCAPLDISAERLAELGQLLSADEWRRAGRIHQERDWKRFVVARATLREILGRLLEVDPASLVFALGEFGKPKIASPQTAQCIHFNLAHSDSLALFAVSEHEVGVDLEHVRAVAEADDIASRFFSPREEQLLQALPEEQRLEGFFNCWTRKEAYLKAIGLGLDDCLSQVEVSVAPGEPAQVLGAPKWASPWLLHPLAPADEFIGALAVQEEDSDVNCWYWNGETLREAA